MGDKADVPLSPGAPFMGTLRIVRTNAPYNQGYMFSALLPFFFFTYLLVTFYKVLPYHVRLATADPLYYYFHSENLSVYKFLE